MTVQQHGPSSSEDPLTKSLATTELALSEFARRAVAPSFVFPARHGILFSFFIFQIFQSSDTPKLGQTWSISIYLQQPHAVFDFPSGSGSESWTLTSCFQHTSCCPLSATLPPAPCALPVFSVCPHLPHFRHGGLRPTPQNRVYTPNQDCSSATQTPVPCTYTCIPPECYLKYPRQYLAATCTLQLGRTLLIEQPRLTEPLGHCKCLRETPSSPTAFSII